MTLTIKNKELQEIDNEILILNKEYSMVLHSLNKFPNIYAAQQMAYKIKALISRLSVIASEDEFDGLVKENYIENLNGQLVYCDYFSTRTKDSTEQFFKKVLGDDALEIIKRAICEFDYKAFWEFYKSYEEYTYRQIPSDDESLRDEFKQILSELKKDVLSYASQNYNLPENYEFDLLLAQPYSPNTFFHPTTKRMEVSPSTFFVFRDDSGTNINVCYVIEALFHELLGHGRHEYNSRLLPRGLQSTAINLAVATAHIHAEGVSQITRIDAISFMRKYQQKYKIAEDYIRQRELSTVADNCNTFLVYYKYLKLLNLENPKIDIEKEFLSMTNNYGLYLLFSTSDESPLSIMKHAAYPLGLAYMKNLLDSLKKNLGETFYKENHARINQVISTGLWHFKILPKFVLYALKKFD